MKELITIFADTLKFMPKKYVFIALILWFGLRYIAGLTFMYGYWFGAGTRAELLEFLRLLMNR